MFFQLFFVNRYVQINCLTVYDMQISDRIRNDVRIGRKRKTRYSDWLKRVFGPRNYIAHNDDKWEDPQGFPVAQLLFKEDDHGTYIYSADIISL